MNNATCCMMTTSRVHTSAGKAADGKARPSSAGRRGFAVGKFSLPMLILALLPKCPACFAAYLALGTGISVSVTVASLFRTLLIGICVTSLVWIFASAFRSALMNRLRSDSRLY
ncbi:hypothetical protein AYO50_02160 [Acidobacteria bacterium SCGC AG-212-P17]|nr:hypothetical protein AYO50_02160 [Acidobacteria bacterium SCGC AG-212-P17]